MKISAIREEVLKKAYREFWEKIKEYVDPDTGALDCAYWLEHNLKIDFERVGFTHRRPISLSGFENNNGWYSIAEGKFPEEGIEVECYHEKWIDEDLNPLGIRAGFLVDNEFTTAYYGYSQDTYMTISRTECENSTMYSNEISTFTEPTHWRPYTNKKPLY